MYVGYLFHFDREKFNKKALADLDVPGHIATLSLEVDDWSRRGVEACLITVDGTSVDYIALARQGDMIVTGEYRIVLHHLTKVPSVTLEREETDCFSRISTHTCVRPPTETWVHLAARIEREAGYVWRDMMSRLDMSKQRLGEAGYDVMAMERDAVGIALEISAFDRGAELAGRERVVAGPGSYLSRLRGATRGKSIEDRLIEHDARIFGGLRMNPTDVVGTAVFEKRGTGERLYVTNANRTKIETTLGVDLVYFNETYESFVMVQYKRLLREGGDFVYRPEHDDSYAKELQKMLRCNEQLGSADTSDPISYRLDPGTFYFKICTDAFFDPLSVDMIEGMYFPVRYWQMVSRSDLFVGKLGGRRVSYDKSGRCLSNDLFSKLVRFGWIGSPSAHSERLNDFIDASLQSKRSVVLAHNTRRGGRK